MIADLAGAGLPFLIFFLALIVLEGLFSGGEIALISCDNYRIRQKAASGSSSARVALGLLERPERFLATTLTGTALCQVSNTAIVTSLFITLWGPEKGALTASFVMVLTLLVLGEILPKSLFQHHADTVAPRIAWFIWFASWLFYPVVLVLAGISRGVLYVISEKTGLKYSHYITRSGLESLLKAETESTDITPTERDMIQKVLDFFGYTAEEIMVPLSNVAVVSLQTTLGEAARVIEERNYSRIPVYDKEAFNIIGIIDVFDLMGELSGKSPETPLVGEDSVENVTIRRQILFVPETKRADELFFELQEHSEHMAVVVDEYGGAVGIVTPEDIHEEIVGDINDSVQTDRDQYIRTVGRGRYLVDGLIKTDYLQEQLPLIIPEGDYETLGGFLLAVMGRIPKRRESFKMGEALFVIEEADARSIRKILIVVPAEAGPVKKEQPYP
ncbi:MAG: hemolysin family protein [Syntrophales bacterium]|jgi:CBS domain containing-hemolysin-like protein|nr:hemolysin family protein [Syntrophales bacterium]MCK9527793.1 hemolysin family protein [Syntrophales bacterium]MDX9922110.1 hemolysin family protein [Syntrophales bacterium]